MNAATAYRGRMHDLSDDDHRLIRKIDRVISLFRDIEGRMPSSYIAAFLAVVIKPGQGPTEYARKLGAFQPVMSRILLEISQHPRERDKGLGLVDRHVSPDNLSRMEYYLTPKGMRLLDNILEVFRDREE